MNVRELMAKLMAVDPDREIIMSRDSEGNGYSPLYDLWEGDYSPEWGQVYVEALTEEDIEDGWSETDLCPSHIEKVKALILNPFH